jgi:hypothetical protein
MAKNIKKHQKISEKATPHRKYRKIKILDYAH